MKKYAPPGGLEPPTFRLTAERASQLRHGGLHLAKAKIHLQLKFGPIFCGGLQSRSPCIVYIKETHL